MPEQKSDTKAVFTTKVKERLALHPTQWAGEDSAKVVEAVVASIPDETGKSIELTTADKDVITLASRPTAQIQFAVIKRIVENHGGKLDTDTEGLIKKVVGPTAFKAELIKAGIIKDTGDSGLKDLLG